MGNIDVVKQHLVNGIDIRMLKDAIFGVTPLSGVTLTGQTEMVESLIQQGVMLTPKIKMVEQLCMVPLS